ncbi:hypothetical protein ppKF707_3438 [Metapseudomonas furukawaii]|uniref:Uncharacterized protein n=1 Tax=Metapseudomonas furukawaii TaxID=1149133 RepID=A0AAD1BZ93_METFU|nr:hypothetical protein ppKF707_3438 [Pseudomonas furukawaii]BAU74629.1 hypothetical protein KF707C_29410 [Pseudomonas furukawaii]
MPQGLPGVALSGVEAPCEPRSDSDISPQPCIPHVSESDAFVVEVSSRPRRIHGDTGSRGSGCSREQDEPDRHLRAPPSTPPSGGPTPPQSTTRRHWPA